MPRLKLYSLKNKYKFHLSKNNTFSKEQKTVLLQNFQNLINIINISRAEILSLDKNFI